MALLALAIAEFMAAVLLKAWSFVSTLAGVLLAATSSCSASSADWFALPAVAQLQRLPKGPPPIPKSLRRKVPAQVGPEPEMIP